MDKCYRTQCIREAPVEHKCHACAQHFCSEAHLVGHLQDRECEKSAPNVVDTES